MHPAKVCGLHLSRRIDVAAADVRFERSAADDDPDEVVKGGEDWCIFDRDRGKCLTLEHNRP